MNVDQPCLPCHTWLFEPATWRAAGRYWDEGGRERAAGGTSTIRHSEDAWEIEGSMELAGDPPVRFRKDYRDRGAGQGRTRSALAVRQLAIGRLTGGFFVAEDTIISAFQADGGYVGSEHMTWLTPDRYRARGPFLRSGALVSAWFMDLVRQA